MVPSIWINTDRRCYTEIIPKVQSNQGHKEEQMSLWFYIVCLNCAFTLNKYMYYYYYYIINNFHYIFPQLQDLLA